MLIDPPFSSETAPPLNATLTNVMQTNNATIVELLVMTDPIEGRVFYGTARRDPRDRPNSDIGAKLALGRALRTAARALLKEANAEVRREAKQQQRHEEAALEAHARREERRAQAAIEAKKKEEERRLDELRKQLTLTEHLPTKKPWAEKDWPFYNEKNVSD